jgi:tRNA(fMet)-specific endonuclease VapC
MLDTDSVSFAFREQGGVAERIREHPPSTICISAMTLAELRYGAARRKSKKLHRRIDTFIVEVAVLPFDETCATAYGIIASELAERGSLIGDSDTLIAAHAMALDLTLVTNNVKHFARVKGLRVENWL